MMMDTEMQILRGETTKVDIVDVCANTVTGYRDGHGVAQVIEVHVPDTQCMYETEPRLIITAIKQLLNNAVRYSPQDSPILFTLTCSETDFTISVQDFGKGVDEDEKGYIFEMFRRGKKEEEVGANRGLGIGLGIVKMCVDALKGTAECESVVGEGSTFTLRIPFC
jgi:signal transduction histidine kinase